MKTLAISIAVCAAAVIIGIVWAVLDRRALDRGDEEIRAKNREKE